MPRVPLTEFRKYLSDLLEADLPEEARALAEEAEMRLATPGDWEAAKHQLPSGPAAEQPDHSQPESPPQ